MYSAECLGQNPENSVPCLDFLDTEAVWWFPELPECKGPAFSGNMDQALLLECMTVFLS